MSNVEEPKVEVSIPKVLLGIYWGALGVAVFLSLKATASGTDGYAYLVGACFFGIVSRIIQAEYHHRENRRRHSPA